MSLYKNIQKTLFDAGLSEVEVLLYTELLKEPVKNKWSIVCRTGLPKSTVYAAFQKLEELRMIRKNEHGYSPLSLQGLVNHLKAKNRKMNKVINKMQSISPYLSAPSESIEEIETLFTPDQITEAYFFMSKRPYSINLDFGDFEGFIDTIGGVEIGSKFQKNRAQHAGNKAICTTTGPNTDYFSTKEHEKKFETHIDVMNIDHKGNFTIFSDDDDYVLFNYFKNPNNQTSVLIKSKVVADTQRAQFDMFSRKIGNL